MSVQITMNVRGEVGHVRGTVHANVTVTNLGTTAVVGSLGGMAFFLKDEQGQYINFVQETPVLPDAQLVQPGQSFERSVQFSADPVAAGPKYNLVCHFEQTQDNASQSFQFQQLYTGTQ